MAERWYVRLSSVLTHELSSRQPLILYASQAQFQQTNAIPGQLGEGTGGVTEALRRRIVLPVGGTLGDLDHVIGPELVHAFQYDITGSGRGPGLGAIPGAAALPIWFIEGMAEYLSIGPVASRGALQDSTGDSLPTFGQLDDPRFFPYRYGHAILAFLAGQRGDRVLGDLLRAAGKQRDIDRALRQVFHPPPDTLVARWHAATHAAYTPLRPHTRSAATAGRRLIGAEADEVRYNIAPALSPDGSQLLFFSDRSLFSIELFLADATTGKIKRRITETALDPHLESLQFIQSAGRFPLLGLLGIGSGYYGAFPLELLAFADAGLAWDTENKPRIFGLSGVREPVVSAGVGLRFNLFGFAVAQLDLVRPFDRPAKNWIWQFELQPGF